MYPDNIDHQGVYKNVSRETIEKLNVYVSLLRQWNAKINLISRQDIDHIWDRHIIDSMQLVDFVESKVQRMADLGSGGGFPGMVLSIVTGVPMIMVESDVRKAVFLREVARQLDVNVTVFNQRIEQVEMPLVDMISVRALASLDQLLFLCNGRLTDHGYCLFLKGRQVDVEIAQAQKEWQIEFQKIPSKTSSDGVILKVNQFKRIV
ncbi:16S rRNA (guanine(527)-N(7))-methyltransferase RsmG [Commensalibacter oyaizuii]|uniref:Ribosomal RNA small subunit methyltransferase G n=1 Tax=Commensalibacter oyaizuii TaxID=3043873 RepID=A0ABT6Q1Y5_9PROT|nr:16S rRNA (guanine(527)-N(7))-methyltransferase RsmG [Commensalibacter sp. TBRC 16381]MDI2091129.1 16S rRNA (guanine(527)-N(7))-methyltransferase RsmG [Commensalibacter sp. TBRC 16381]